MGGSFKSKEAKRFKRLREGGRETGKGGKGGEGTEPGDWGVLSGREGAPPTLSDPQGLLDSAPRDLKAAGPGLCM